MKNTVSMVVYLITFFAMFFILSMLGMVFGFTYKESLESEQWFIIYFMFLGWWMALIPAHDTYNLMQAKEIEKEMMRKRNTF